MYLNIKIYNKKQRKERRRNVLSNQVFMCLIELKNAACFIVNDDQPDCFIFFTSYFFFFWWCLYPRMNEAQPNRNFNSMLHCTRQLCVLTQSRRPFRLFFKSIEFCLINSEKKIVWFLIGNATYTVFRCDWNNFTVHERILMNFCCTFVSKRDSSNCNEMTLRYN